MGDAWLLYSSLAGGELLNVETTVTILSEIEWIRAVYMGREDENRR